MLEHQASSRCPGSRVNRCSPCVEAHTNLDNPPHPDWALASLDGALDAHPDDHRLHHLASLALVDHFEPSRAYTEAQKALTLCDLGSSVTCGEAERGRLDLLKNTLERIKNMDMRRDPNSAKGELIKGLRLTFIPKKAADHAKPAPAPASKPNHP